MTNQNSDRKPEERTGGPEDAQPTGTIGRGRGELDEASTDSGADRINEAQGNEAPISAADQGRD